MAGFVTDNEFEIELNKMLTFLENIKREQTIFFSTRTTLALKEKVKLIQKISADHKKIEMFLEKSKQEDLYNPGIRFKLENLKNRYASLFGQWKKMEKLDD